MKPTVGRIVHFTALEGNPGPYAGIIVRVYLVDDDWETVDLVTFGSGSIHHENDVDFSETRKPGCWSWPPRAE